MPELPAPDRPRGTSTIKRIAKGAGALLAVALAGVGVFVWTQVSAYDASMDKVYDVPVPAVTRSTDPAVVARGEHVAAAIAGCTNPDCHGADLGGGRRTVTFGPLGGFTAPNISQGGLGAAYSDGELARLIRHGIKRDGRSLRFMPVEDFDWLPDDDLVAVVSYMRAQPAVDRPNGPTAFSALAKVLDRRGKFTLDVARRIDHSATTAVPAASAAAGYGLYLAKTCTGCHGEHLSGGPIPGAPSTLPVPLNLTPNDDGLAHFSYDDFDRALTKGVKPNGDKLNPFMPAGFGELEGTEKHALWAYLQTLPPTPFGQR